VDDVAVEHQCIFAPDDGTAAMHALRCVADGRDGATAANAPLVALEARTCHGFFGYLSHLGETDGAREREAGFTQRLSRRIYEQATQVSAVVILRFLLRLGSVAVGRSKDKGCRIARYGPRSGMVPCAESSWFDATACDRGGSTAVSRDGSRAGIEGKREDFT
jgi:hypothetical protein